MKRKPAALQYRLHRCKRRIAKCRQQLKRESKGDHENSHCVVLEAQFEVQVYGDCGESEECQGLALGSQGYVILPDAAEYEVDKVYESGYIRLVSTTGSALDKATGSVGSVFPEGQQNVVIVYNAGVTSVPAYVKLAAILCISEIAVFSERAGANASLAVSRASQRAGDGAAYQTAAALAGKMRTIVRNTIGQKWRFK